MKRYETAGNTNMIIWQLFPDVYPKMMWSKKSWFESHVVFSTFAPRRIPTVNPWKERGRLVHLAKKHVVFCVILKTGGVVGWLKDVEWLDGWLIKQTEWVLIILFSKSILLLIFVDHPLDHTLFQFLNDVGMACRNTHHEELVWENPRFDIWHDNILHSPSRMLT